MHTIDTAIPELEALLEEGSKTEITPPIQHAIRQYYRRFADQRRVQQFTDWINAEYGTKLTANKVSKYYNNHLKERA